MNYFYFGALENNHPFSGRGLRIIQSEVCFFIPIEIGIKKHTSLC